jgi:hypothetical protein
LLLGEERKSFFVMWVLVFLIGAVMMMTYQEPNGAYQLPVTMIQSNSAENVYTSNMPTEYSFSIRDSAGEVVKDFAITHTKLMHVIVARQDLAYFQHLHPEFNKETGVFTVKDLMFPDDGVYRIFADFVPSNTKIPTTISEDVSVGVGEKYKPEAFGSEEKVKVFNGVKVSLMNHGVFKTGEESMLRFSLSQDGKPVIDLETYLGALGHSIILREGSLDFIHAHPMGNMNTTQNGNINFMVDFPETGRYKIFTQFQRNEKVFTTDFVVSVAEGATNSNRMETMNH